MIYLHHRKILATNVNPPTKWIFIFCCEVLCCNTIEQHFIGIYFVRFRIHKSQLDRMDNTLYYTVLLYGAVQQMIRILTKCQQKVETTSSTESLILSGSIQKQRQ